MTFAKGKPEKLLLRRCHWLAALGLLCIVTIHTACVHAPQPPIDDVSPTAGTAEILSANSLPTADTPEKSEAAAPASGSGSAAGVAPLPAAAGSAPASPYGPPSLDERIFFADVVVLARPISVEPGVLTMRPRAGQTRYSPMVQSRYEVIEYLKGDGDSEIIVDTKNIHVTAPSAEQALQSAEGILATQVANTSSGEVVVFFRRMQHHPYIILDVSLKASETEWKQHNAQTGLFATGGGISAPSTTFRIASASASGTERRETFSIAHLRERIEAMESLLKEGEGIEGYKECIESRFLHENFRRKYKIDLASVSDIATFPSGMPAEFVIEEFTARYAREWFSGENARLFHYGAKEITTTRPLPAGSYEVDSHFQKHEWVPCDYTAPPAIWRYIFEVSAGTLHEAFFDPVAIDSAIGAAVGADTDNGALNPASFAVEGAGDVSIDRLEWEDGQVRMRLSPSMSLPDHHIDFIALDGTVGLRLDFDDAVEIDDGRTRALSWGVCAQPWADGDLLMLRISASGSDLLHGATNDADCAAATPAPTSTTTPTPTHEPTPTPTATPTSTPTPTPATETLYFYPTSDDYINPPITLSGKASGCGAQGIWACMDETEPDNEQSMIHLYSGSALRVGFTVESDAIPGTVTDVRFEVVVSAQSGTVQTGEYGYTVYSGGAVVAELSGQDEVGEDWQDITVSDAAILSGLSGDLGEVAFQVDGPSSNQALKMTRVRMVVEYAASEGGE